MAWLVVTARSHNPAVWMLGFVQIAKKMNAIAPRMSVPIIDASGRTMGGHSRLNRIPNTGQIEKMTKEIVAKIL